MVAKTIERIIVNRLLAQLKFNCRQFGFRRAHCTRDPVWAAIDQICRGFQQYYDLGRPDHPNKTYFKAGRTCAVFYDLTAAFDKVDIQILINNLAEQDVKPCLLRWVRNFLHNRQACVEMDGRRSPFKKLSRGVPQGTITGPVLWLVYIDSLLKELDTVDGLQTFAFADDLTTMAHSPTAALAKDTLQVAASIVNSWCNTHNMSISRDKTVGVIYRQSNVSMEDKSENLFITCGDSTVRLFESDSAKLLGVTLDRALVFDQHIGGVVKEARTRICQLRALANPTLGANLHALRCFYKGYVESVLLYAAECWWPITSPTQRLRLEVLQRKALRVVTGLPHSTPTKDLYLEADALPLNNIIQARLASLQEEHIRHSDHRRIEAMRPPNSEPSNVVTNHQRKDIPKPNSPQLRAWQLLQAMTHPEDQTAEPLLELPRLHPENLALLHNHVSFGISTDRPVDSIDQSALTKAEKHRLRAAKYLSNEETIFRLRQSSKHKGNTLFEAWTDAAVTGREERGAGAHGIFRKLSDRSGQWEYSQCGKGVCSFRAELLTIEDLLTRATKWCEKRRRYVKGKWILIFTDSQSSVAAIATGPISHRVNAQTEDRCWSHLRQLTDLGVKVHFQFIYSHCNTRRNELADTHASKALDLCYERRACWITDKRRFIERRIQEDWEKETALQVTHRSTIFGDTTIQLDRHQSREATTRLARLRVGESLDLGILRRRMHLDRSMACRWCCSHAHRHKADVADLPPTAPEIVVSTEPQKCLHCAVETWLANTKSIRSHYASQHAGVQLPQKWAAKPRAAAGSRTKSAPTPLRPCKHCGELKPRAHEPLCPSRVEPKKVPEIPTHLQPPPEGTPAETLWHLTTSCPRLRSLRQKHGIRTLTRKLLLSEKLLQFVDDAKHLLGLGYSVASVTNANNSVASVTWRRPSTRNGYSLRGQAVTPGTAWTPHKGVSRGGLLAHSPAQQAHFGARVGVRSVSRHFLCLRCVALFGAFTSYDIS